MNPVEIKSPDEIALMREAGRIVCEILDELEKAVAPGVSTWDLDALAEQLIAKKGARSAFKGYHGFPGVLCASVNQEVVHGIPNRKRRLVAGDLMKLDFGVVYRGFFGDSARTVPVGKVTPEAQALVDVTRQSLEKAIQAMQPGNRIGDIGHAVQNHVEARGFSVVRDFTGHGIGRKLHEPPQVPNYGQAGSGMKLRPGMVLAVEPMVNQGTPDVEVLEDEWTAVTVDGKLSAHFEHTILISERGPEVLTRRR
ncbi:type I methionyl aminopeptidase [Corallococcus exiguus]|uniref:Methionine aminopeptidase n=1 Tax=Corallococcus exiguus TaxID=83462 RepID=A0A7X4Y6C7_9BACT|nr:MULTISPECIES: type I methionyl aminopeptidase [Corallococcus]NBC39490.1 type I methionyl aminopeptidase [Corallococcus exiguus]NNC19556.1 type I methionyl aminopeptidase [Corallococcus exiguus]NRD56927.1 type I methionyl aminopeptidase [Corallococcus exiguus]NRD63424.1 type I methionyl aminopeptidase [Corallococcus exiguus]RKH30447.1 type I methionyl aminopeptidase [Corallococcus sp. CA041A]